MGPVDTPLGGKGRCPGFSGVPEIADTFLCYSNVDCTR